MGKKRNIGSVGGSDGAPVRTSRWWCYYCDAEARDESALITHQLAKHFRCPFCDPRSAGGFCQGMAGLFSHVRRSHAKELTEVPGAIEGRKDVKVEVYGMTGIPDGFAADSVEGEPKPETTPPPPAVPSTGGPHTVPPRDFSQTSSGQIVTPPPAVPLGAGAAQLTAVLQAAQALQGPQIAGILQQAQAMQAAQALQTAQTLQALQALQPSAQLTSLLAPTAITPPPPQPALSPLLGLPPGLQPAPSLIPGLLPQVPGLAPSGLSAPSPDLSALLAPPSLLAPPPALQTLPVPSLPPPDLVASIASTAPTSIVSSSPALPTLPPISLPATSPGLQSSSNTLVTAENGNATAGAIVAGVTPAANPNMALLGNAPVTSMPPLVTQPPALTVETNGATLPTATVSSSTQASLATAPEASSGAESKTQPHLVTMLTLIPQVCGNWEDSEGGLIVIKSGPDCTVILTHETQGQQTIKYEDFIKDGKFRYRERDGILESGGGKIAWNDGSVWTRE